MATSPRTIALASVFTQNQLIAGLEPYMAKADEFTQWLLAGAMVTDRPAIDINRKAAYNTASWTSCASTISPVSLSASNVSFDMCSLKQAFDVCAEVQSQSSTFTDQFEAELESTVEDLMYTLGESAINGAGTSNEIYGIDTLMASGQAVAQDGTSLAYTDLNAAYRRVKRKSTRMAWVCGATAHDAVLNVISGTDGRTNSTMIDVIGGQLNVPMYRTAPVLLSDHATTDSIYLVNGDFSAGGVGLFLGVNAFDEESLNQLIRVKYAGSRVVDSSNAIDAEVYLATIRVALAQKHALATAEVSSVS